MPALAEHQTSSGSCSLGHETFYVDPLVPYGGSIAPSLSLALPPAVSPAQLKGKGRSFFAHEGRPPSLPRSWAWLLRNRTEGRRRVSLILGSLGGARRARDRLFFNPLPKGGIRSFREEALSKLKY
ncbi:hypothetical protein NL676_017226 [Syzygium grande]|nr:hypothetical protein NL676_017226 [Syzygium grande]